MKIKLNGWPSHISASPNLALLAKTPLDWSVTKICNEMRNVADYSIRGCHHKLLSGLICDLCVHLELIRQGLWKTKVLFWAHAGLFFKWKDVLVWHQTLPSDRCNSQHMLRHPRSHSHSPPFLLTSKVVSSCTRLCICVCGYLRFSNRPQVKASPWWRILGVFVLFFCVTCWSYVLWFLC